MLDSRITPLEVARTLCAQLHPECDCLLLAGSFVRGEATVSSDLDIVVLYPELPQAYRESLFWEGYPVEMFVHDPQTLRYFFEKFDGPTGFPLLMQMVCEGIEIPRPTELSSAMKRLAQTVIETGPPVLATDELAQRRYEITDLVDDIRTPRSREELTASGALLQGQLADFYFRSQNLWSARGKTIPRKLRQHSPEFSVRFGTAFDALFKQGETELVIALAEEVLKMCGGGFLFDGFRRDAPADFKL